MHPPEIGIPNAIAQPGLMLGGAPTEEHLEEAVRLGYTTFIDLRLPDEPEAMRARQVLARLNAPYQCIPVHGAGGLTKENACALDEAMNATPGPTLLFCRSGNRVGALLAMRAFLVHNTSAAEALRYGKACGMTKLQDAVSLLLGL